MFNFKVKITLLNEYSYILKNLFSFCEKSRYIIVFSPWIPLADVKVDKCSTKSMQSEIEGSNMLCTCHKPGSFNPIVVVLMFLF